MECIPALHKDSQVSERCLHQQRAAGNPRCGRWAWFLPPKVHGVGFIGRLSLYQNEPTFFRLCPVEILHGLRKMGSVGFSCSRGRMLGIRPKAVSVQVPRGGFLKGCRIGGVLGLSLLC